MLGYSDGQPTTNSHFGRVDGTFAMDNVQCRGNEISILACPHQTQGQDDCGGHEGAGVICDGIFQFFPIRFMLL